MRTVILSFIALTVMIFALSACGPDKNQADITLRVWCHQGQEAENEAMRGMAEAFNTAYRNRGIRADVQFFPDYQYTEKILTAAGAGDLPDAMDLDGPTVAQFAEAGLLMPLDEWIDAETRNDFLPTILKQGTFNETLYALGAFDSALVLYYNRTMLENAGIDPPENGWTWEAFMSACRELKASGVRPVALHMNESADEWFTYAFSPLIWSGGGRLISADGSTAEGVLNSDVNVKALRQWQMLFTEDLAAVAPVDPNPFASGKTAMDWTGHWMARGHQQALGEDLGAMPLPRTGADAAAACGSWCWAVSAHTRHAEAAVEWLKWVTDPEHGVQPIVAANGAVPARSSAFPLFPEYEHPPYALFRTLLEQSGRPRPRTPHYAALTQHFAAALRDIAGGADVRESLDRAATRIQQIINR